ncbi:MAG: hypothetical protein J6Y99_03465 [Bacteroidales bacterium]|nr:hypothetical protein [Bacteroidales bacterium]
MAQVNPNATIYSMSGKVNQMSNIYYRTNKQTGKVFTGTLLRKVTASNANQLALQEKFIQRNALVNDWMAANKPSVSQPKGSELYQAVLRAYKSQHKIGTFRGYVSHRIDEEGNVKA